MKKRIVSFLLALVMAVSLLPVSAFAADGVYTVAKDAAVQQGDDAPVTVSAGDARYEVTITHIKGYFLDGAVIEIPIYKALVPIDAVDVTFTTNSAATDIVDFAYVGSKALENKQCVISTSSLLKPPYVKDIRTDGNTNLGIVFQMEDGYTVENTFDLTNTFAYVEFTNDKDNYIGLFGLVIEFTAAETTNKAALEKAVADAQNISNGNSYYTGNDRYNGKLISKNGFWADFQAQLAKSQSVLDSKKALQDEIDAAVADLTAAIANLIPADRANTTVLYEALRSKYYESSYTAKSWAIYKPVLDKAEALMATMFDAEGNPTDANKAAAQESIETMAAELKAAREALDEKAGDDTKTIAKLELEAIRYLAKKYDPDTLTGYTAESVQALRDARTAALTLADSVTVTDMSEAERNQITMALLNLRKAAYGLETVSQEKITVKVSQLYASDVYGKLTAANCHTNTYTAALTLDANASASAALTGKTALPSGYDALYFLNGELLYDGFGMTQYSVRSDVFQAVKLHNGDELTVVNIYPKQIPNSSQDGTTYNAVVEDVVDWFRYSTVSAPVEVEAGQTFTVSVASETAMPFHTAAGTAPVAGAKVYRSAAAESAEAAATGYVGVDTYAVTDESGKAALTLYDEGYVLLNVQSGDPRRVPAIHHGL